MAGDRAVKLDWQIPNTDKKPAPGKRLLFPASTLGRKGAYELREPTHQLTVTGPVLGTPNFW